MDFKERFYLILAGIFIASLVSCNLIFQKFFTWSPFGIYTFEISVGILPYPITFLATDLISELYGQKKSGPGCDIRLDSQCIYYDSSIDCKCCT